MKTLKNAHNTGFLRLARPGSAGRVVSVWGEKVGRAAPALCLSLLNSPLVNRVLGHSSWSAKPGSTAKYSGIREWRARRHHEMNEDAIDLRLQGDSTPHRSATKLQGDDRGATVRIPDLG